MTLERWEQVKELLHAALKRSPAERAAFLIEACGEDVSLRREMESLLAWAEKGEGLEQSPLSGISDPEKPLHSMEPRGTATVTKPPDAGELKRRGTPSVEMERIGSYRLRREIGRGGMGVVYLAVRDDDEFKKRVAIKLLRKGMESEDIMRRFRNERQILAGMSHPYMAELHDGGTTEEGLPYFVMEYIEGRPIDEYCDSHKLSIAERLKLGDVKKLVETCISDSWSCSRFTP